jgi:hypothetical protein
LSFGLILVTFGYENLIKLKLKVKLRIMDPEDYNNHKNLGILIINKIGGIFQGGYTPPLR